MIDICADYFHNVNMKCGVSILFNEYLPLKSDGRILSWIYEFA
jgi:hypothetical protein